jgi:putative sigma-54 modulation protein
MKLLIKATNLTLSQDLKNHIREKIGGLEKFTKKYGSEVEARVEVGKVTLHHQEGDIFRAEVNIFVPGKILRAEANARDVFLAIDEIRDEIERQLIEHKSKLRVRFKKGARKLKETLRFGRLFWK